MHRPFTLGTVIVVVAGAPCRADITPVQGTQSMSGAARVWGGGAVLLASGTFDLSAPDPRASWAPPTQDITAQPAPPVGSMYAHVVADYASGIGPGAVTLATRVQTDGIGGSFVGSCQFEWNQAFSLKFTLNAPGQYVVGGLLRHQSSSWITPSLPMTMAFGVEGTSSVFSLTIPGFQNGFSPPVVSSFGPTVLSLPAGTYVIQASSATAPIYSAHAPNNIDVRMYFTITDCIAAYADCDLNGMRSIADFTCFQAKFAAGDPHADCDGSGQLTVADFTCFQGLFVQGCP